MDTAIIAREKGIKNVIVSAGYINEKPLREWCKYIDAAHIDLKSFSNEIYEMLNAGKLDPVLNTIRILKEEGIWFEIINLVIPTWTDDLDMIKRMCQWLAVNGFKDTPLHFSRFHPLYKLANLPATPVTTLERAREAALSGKSKGSSPVGRFRFCLYWKCSRDASRKHFLPGLQKNCNCTERIQNY